MIPSTSQVLSIILFILCIPSTLFTVTATNKFVSCLQNEKDALLQFKSTLIDPYENLASWNSSNCCNWRGIRCHNITHHVSRINLRNSNLLGEINPSLLTLQHLIHLDLSFNFFNFKPVPQFLGSIKSLRYLNLSNAGFSGEVPPSLGNLSSLHVLDLSILQYPSYDHFIMWYLSSDISLQWWQPSSDYALRVSDSQWLSQLTALRDLEMSGVNFTYASSWLQDLNSLPHIKKLGLRYCELRTIPLVLPHVNFTYLNFLDLSYNRINSTIPTWLFKITSLEYLDLSVNIEFHGLVPTDIRNLTSLYALVLSFNKIDMSLAVSQLGNLRKLQYLHADYVTKLINCHFHELGGNFSELATTLQVLSLCCSHLNGSLPHWIGNFTNLRLLDVTANSLSGVIPSSFGQLSGLQELRLEKNNFNGTVPESLGGLSELLYFSLNANSLEGDISETHFQDLRNLLFFSISSNSLVLNVSRDWIPPFQLQYLDMSECLVGPGFPMWLSTQKTLVFLYLSHAGISDTMPDLFWSLTPHLYYLDLSLNAIRGNVPSSLQFTSYRYTLPLGGYIGAHMDLSSNFFEGPLPHSVANVEELILSNNSFSGPLPQDIHKTMPKLEALDLSLNNLSGTIPLELCQLKYLEALDISTNLLIGEIPDCWKDDAVLEVLDLSFNNLSGKIPYSVFSLPLVSLSLNNNKFSGEIPSSLQKCHDMLYLDLGYNELTGNILTWLGDKQLRLYTLILHSNMFTGSIPPQLSFLPLRILDLSGNNLTGTIPESFGNFIYMTKIITGWHPENVRYSSSMELTVKNRSLVYDGDLPTISVIDLSENNLHGSIPHELSNLKGLQVLNLSGNHLTGEITPEIGSMTSLESLDLSRNELLGAIPTTLSNLSFLSWLNLSYNNLSGLIPRGGQLSTFNDPSVYIRNEGLCGVPLSKTCPVHAPKTHVDALDSGEDEDLWFYLGALSGFVLGSWSVWVVFVWKKSWRIAYFLFAQQIIDAVYVSIAVNLARLKQLE